MDVSSLTDDELLSVLNGEANAADSNTDNINLSDMSDDELLAALNGEKQQQPKAEARDLGFMERHSLRSESATGREFSDAEGLAASVVPFYGTGTEMWAGARQKALDEAYKTGEVPSHWYAPWSKSLSGLDDIAKEWDANEGVKYDLYQRALKGEKGVDYSPIYARVFDEKKGKYTTKRNADGKPLLDSKYSYDKEEDRKAFIREHAKAQIDEIVKTQNNAQAQIDADTAPWYDPSYLGYMASNALGYAGEYLAGGAVAKGALAGTKFAGAYNAAAQAAWKGHKLAKIGKVSADIATPMVASAIKRYENLTADDYKMDESGNISLNREGLGAVKGAAQAVAGAAGEAYSEALLGEAAGYLAKVGLGKVAKGVWNKVPGVKKLFDTATSKLGDAKVDAAKKMWVRAAQTYGKVKNSTYYNMMPSPGEFVEEYGQGFLDDVVGLNTKDAKDNTSLGDFTRQFFSWDAGGKDLFFGVMGQSIALGLGGYAGQRGKRFTDSLDSKVVGALKLQGYTNADLVKMSAATRIALAAQSGDRAAEAVRGMGYDIVELARLGGVKEKEIDAFKDACEKKFGENKAKTYDALNDAEKAAIDKQITDFAAPIYSASYAFREGVDGATELMSHLNKQMQKYIGLAEERQALGNYKANRTSKPGDFTSRVDWTGSTDEAGNINWQQDNNGVYIESAPIGDEGVGARIYKRGDKFIAAHPQTGTMHVADNIADAHDWIAAADQFAQKKNRDREVMSEYIRFNAQRLVPTQKDKKTGETLGASVVTANNAMDAVNKFDWLNDADRAQLETAAMDGTEGNAITLGDGTVVMFLDNIQSADEALFALSHEIGGHAAIKEGTKEKNLSLEDTIAEVFRGSETKDTKAAQGEYRIRRTQGESKDDARAVAQEEGMVYGNEYRMPTASPLQKAKTAVKLWMKKHGMDAKLTDEDYEAIASAGLSRIRQTRTGGTDSRSVDAGGVTAERTDGGEALQRNYEKGKWVSEYYEQREREEAAKAEADAKEAADRRAAEAEEERREEERIAAEREDWGEPVAQTADGEDISVPSEQLDAGDTITITSGESGDSLSLTVDERTDDTMTFSADDGFGTAIKVEFNAEKGEWEYVEEGNEDDGGEQEGGRGETAGDAEREAAERDARAAGDEAGGDGERTEAPRADTEGEVEEEAGGNAEEEKAETAPESASSPSPSSISPSMRDKIAADPAMRDIARRAKEAKTDAEKARLQEEFAKRWREIEGEGEEKDEGEGKGEGKAENAATAPAPEPEPEPAPEPKAKAPAPIPRKGKAKAKAKKSAKWRRGVPYQGSKSRIADSIVAILPRGKRFVDLFSGGGAVTHSAMLSGKYGAYRMNDIDGGAQDLFVGAVNGKYADYENPHYTDEQFASVKGTPEAYMLSFNGLGRNLAKKTMDGRDRAEEQIRRVKELGELKDAAKSIEDSKTDYRNVELKRGDVVYADIPYEETDTRGYRNGARFDKDEFVKWAQEQKVPVYVSEYAMPDGWTEIGSFDVPGMRGGRREEKLFVQSKFAEKGKWRRLSPSPSPSPSPDSQYRAVESAYRNTDRWMKAPNGKPTKLTERQWVQVRTPAFKAWFGDWENDPANASKVLDENGEPLVVYHGADNVYHTFEQKQSFHTTNQDAAKTYAFGKNGIMQANYVKATNPLIVSANGGDWISIETPQALRDRFADETELPYGRGFKAIFDEFYMSARDMAVFAKEAGYDALIVKDVMDNYDSETFTGDDVVTFSPTQIKSATDNNGAFSGANADIRWRRANGIGEETHRKLGRDFDALLSISQSEDSPQGKWRRAKEAGLDRGTMDDYVKALREDRFADGETTKSGAESIVKRIGDKVVKFRKTDGMDADAARKVAQFNALFPDMAYEFKGIADVDGEPRLVLEQPYVDTLPNSGTEARRQLVERFKERFGAENVKTHGDIAERNLLAPKSWFKVDAGPWHIEDLKDLNLGIDKRDGKVKVWDAEIAYDAAKDAQGKAQGKWRRSSIVTPEQESQFDNGILNYAKNKKAAHIERAGAVAGGENLTRMFVQRPDANGVQGAPSEFGGNPEEWDEYSEADKGLFSAAGRAGILRRDADEAARLEAHSALPSGQADFAGGESVVYDDKEGGRVVKSRRFNYTLDEGLRQVAAFNGLLGSLGSTYYTLNAVGTTERVGAGGRGYATRPAAVLSQRKVRFVPHSHGRAMERVKAHLAQFGKVDDSQRNALKVAGYTILDLNRNNVGIDRNTGKAAVIDAGIVGNGIRWRRNITPEEDAAYADAVKRGDRETALRMIREAAAKAMPNTKVVDKDGLPHVCYHDSGELHNILSRDYARKSMDVEAVFFHLKSDKYHEYGNVEHKVFLNIEHPANFKQAHEGFEYGVTDDAGVKQREKLQREGYDGAIFTAEEMGGEDLAEAFVFDSNQIKSADITYDDAGNLIPLSERFNSSNNDIRWRRRYTPSPIAQTLADLRVRSVTDLLRAAKFGTDSAALFAAEKLARELAQQGSVSPELRDLVERTQSGNPAERAKGNLAAMFSPQNLSAWRERMQDALISLRELEDRLGVGKGESAYHQFDRNYGMIAKAMDDLRREVLTPLAKELKDNGIPLADFSRLLLALHGAERNRMIAERSPYVLKAMADKRTAPIVNDILNGKRDLDDAAIADISAALGWIDKGGNRTKESRQFERDLAGSGATTAAWNADIARFTADGTMAKAQNAIALVRELTKRNRDLLVDTGRMSAAQRDLWEKLSPNYVPMRSDMEMDANVWSKWLLGGGADGGGSGGKRYGESEYNHAYGRGTLADSPLEFAIQQYEESLQRAWDNVARRHLAELVRNNPNLGNVFRYEPQMNATKRARYAKAIAIIRNMVKAGTATAKDIEKMNWYQEAFNAETAVPMVKVLGTNGIAYEVPNIAGMEGTRERPTGIIAFKEDGNLKFISLGGFSQADVNADPSKLDDVAAKRIATAVKRQNMAQLNGVGRFMRKATGIFSALRTAYSPTFLVSNFGADNTQAMRNVYATFGVGAVGKFEHYAMHSFGAAKSVISGNFGTTKIQQYAKEWYENGGKIGGMATTSIADLANDIRRTMRKLNPQRQQLANVNGVRDFLAWATDRKDDLENLVEKMNAIVEMSTRIATYATARDLGYSVEDAVSYSRDVTVNFNRKGTLTPWLNAMYAFSNATMQDLHRSLVAFGEGHAAKGVGILAGRGAKMGFGLMLMGFIASAFGFWQDDPEDEKEGRAQWKYAKDWEKQNVMGVRIGEKTYGVPIRGISRIPYYLGHQVYEMMTGRKNPAKAAADTIALAASNATDFMGQASSPLMTAVPSVARDPLDIFISNKTFTGRQRYREPLPGQEETAVRSEMGRKDTSEAAKAVARALNAMTGGDEGRRGLIDMQPEKIRGVWEWVFGSAGKDISNVIGTAKDVATLNIGNRDVRNIPYLSRFAHGLSENSADYYAARGKYEQAKKHYNSMAETGRKDRMEEDVAEHPWLSSHGDGKRWGKRLNDLDVAVKRLMELEKAASPEDYDEIHGLRLKTQYQFIRRMERPPKDDADGVMDENEHKRATAPILRSSKREKKADKREQKKLKKLF